jgi:hypothetical protein
MGVPTLAEPESLILDSLLHETMKKKPAMDNKRIRYLKNRLNYNELGALNIK